MITQYILLIRPVNFVITALSILVSCIIAGGVFPKDFLPILFSSLGGALIGGGGMVINDIIDVETDKINKPDRPIASGAIEKFDALMFYAGLTGMGLIMSYYASWEAFIIAFTAVPMIFMYSYWLKATPLAGNLLVAALTGTAFLYGGAAIGNMEKAFIPALFAFMINAGREIVKDMEDIDGDKKNHVRTMPVVYGMHKSTLLATFFLCAVIISTIPPFIIGIYGLSYFIIVNIGVNVVLLYVIISLWKERTVARLHTLSWILKWDMLVGLVAIYLG